MSITFTKAAAQCPHCDVRKNQIDTSPERAAQVVSDAIAEHVTEAHPEAAS